MTINLLDEKIAEIAERTNCILSKNQGKFHLSFDIRNIDFSKYILEHKTKDYDIIAVCELLEGTSDKPSYFSGNTPVQNRYNIICKYKTKNKIPIFSIYESGVFRKLFSNKIIEIKCKDNKFKSYLISLNELALLKKRINNSAEISPAINHKKGKKQNKLSILFQSYTIELELFETLIEFVKKINKAYNTM